MFLLVLIVALAVAWWFDRSRLIQQLNATKDTRRFVTKLNQAGAKVGMTKDEIRAALGPPHDQGVFQGNPWWLFHFDEKPSHYLSIEWDAKDRAATIRHVH
jgi:outer membrane protein assembly factor BamE (lipoprotein component of BamABCDE complex)